MGSNFHTPWTTSSLFKTTSLNPVPSDLDRAISYIKNPIIHCDGRIRYNAATGVLQWTGILRILFVRADGQAIQNTVVAGTVTLSDNEFAYVDLNETNDTAISVAKAAVTTGAASNFKAYNRLLLGYRNTAGDIFFPVYVKNVEQGVVALTSAASVTVNWDKGRTQKITLEHDVDFTFTGGLDGDRLILRVRQDEVGGRDPTWPAKVRYSLDITDIVITPDPDAVDYLVFIYDEDDDKYDVILHSKGHGIVLS